MRSIIALVIVFVAQSDPWTTVTRSIEQATLTEDVSQMKNLRAQILQLQVAAPAGNRKSLMQYAVAYVDWRMAFNPAIAEREQTDFLDEAEAQLNLALKTSANLAEARALLCAVYGGKIAHDPMSGMILGPRAENAIEAALRLEPDNPRILLTKAVGKFNTPAEFGGDVKEAEALLRQSLERFEKEPVDKPWPNWGRFDAHAWLGQALAKRGDKIGARAEYQKALTIAPKSGWVRFVLIPALDK